MNRLLVIPTSVIATIAMSSFSFGGLINQVSYSYEQRNSLDGTTITHSGSIDPTPLPVGVTEMVPNGNYVFNLNALPATYTELATHVRIDVDIDQVEDEAWDRVMAQANALASLETLALVQDFGTANGGLVQFNWIVTGSSHIHLDTTGFNQVGVTDLSTTAVLTSSQPGGGLPMTVVHEFPSSASNDEVFDEMLPTASDVIQYFVPWSPNTQIPVFFEMSTAARMEIRNFDAGKFDALLDADYSNTSTLESVIILDDDGAEIVGATLVAEDGFVFPSIPEPSNSLMTLVGLVAFLRRRN